MTAPNEVYYTVREVAEIMRVSRMTVYRLIANGDLEASRPTPRTIRIVRSYLHGKYPEFAETSAQ